MEGIPMDKFIIDINVPLSDEITQYIFDCWITFITNDLGLLPTDLPMTLY